MQWYIFHIFAILALTLGQGHAATFMPSVDRRLRPAGGLNQFQQPFNYGNQGLTTRGRFAGSAASAWNRAAQTARPLPTNNNDLEVMSTGSDWDDSVGQPIPRVDTRPMMNIPEGDFVPNNFRGRGCDKRIRVINGATRIRDRGTLARFQCSYGFHMLGASVAVCVQGQWSDPPPICIRDGCGKLPIPIHGTLRLLYGGAVGIFSCSYGYKMEGERVLMCDGQRWNGSAPYCSEIPPIPVTMPPTKRTTSLPVVQLPAFEEPTTTILPDPVMLPIALVTTTDNTVEDSTVLPEVDLHDDEVEDNAKLPFETTEVNVAEPPETTSAPPVEQTTIPAEIEHPEAVIEVISTTAPTPTTATLEVTSPITESAPTVLDKDVENIPTTTEWSKELHEPDAEPDFLPPTASLPVDTTKVSQEVLVAPTTNLPETTSLSTLCSDCDVNQIQTTQTAEISTSANFVKAPVITFEQAPTPPPEVLINEWTTTTMLSVVQAESTIPNVSISDADSFTVLPTVESHIITVPSHSSEIVTVPPQPSEITTVPPQQFDIVTVPPEQFDIVTVPPQESDIVTVPRQESDIVTVPKQPSEEDPMVSSEDTTRTMSTITEAVTTEPNVSEPTSPNPDTAQTWHHQDFDFSHENDEIREYVAISPSKLDVDAGSQAQHLAVGHLLVIAGTALVTIGFITIVGGLLMYCWRRNKGIARPHRNDTDGRTLSFHEGTDELIWYDPRGAEGEHTRL